MLQFLGLSQASKEQEAQSVCKELAVYFGEVYAEKYQNLASQGYEVTINITIGTASQIVSFTAPVESRLRKLHFSAVATANPLEKNLDLLSQR